jgi:hypothetical protein
MCGVDVHCFESADFLAAKRRIVGHGKHDAGSVGAPAYKPVECSATALRSEPTEASDGVGSGYVQPWSGVEGVERTLFLQPDNRGKVE